MAVFECQNVWLRILDPQNRKVHAPLRFGLGGSLGYTGILHKKAADLLPSAQQKPREGAIFRCFVMEVPGAAGRTQAGPKLPLPWSI